MGLTVSAADAPIRARTSKGFSPSMESGMATTWVSQRKLSANDGRSARSISLQPRMAPSAGPSLPAEERSGDAPGRVHAFFEVDGEREEVDSLPHFLIGGRCDQQLHPSKLEHDCSVGRNGQFAGAEGDFLSTHHPGNSSFRQDYSSIRLDVPGAYSRTQGRYLRSPSEAMSRRYRSTSWFRRYLSSRRRFPTIFSRPRRL